MLRDSILQHENTVTDTGSLTDYVALLKPRVMSLVIFTSICGLILAPVHVHPLIGFIGILCIAVGAGASACLNQWYEIRTDGLMKRTQHRPLPAGRISADTALAFGIILSIGSVLMMFVAVNSLSATLLAFTIFYYVVIYTMILKPYTSQNIVIGGAAGALPPMIGYTVATGSVDFYALSLFLIIFLWTPAHFWALALKYKEDYEAASIPMLPSTHGDEHTRYQILVYTTLTVAASYLPVAFGNHSYTYTFPVLVLNILFLYYSIRLIKEKTPQSAIRMFLYSILYLFMIFSFLVLDGFAFRA